MTGEVVNLRLHRKRKARAAREAAAAENRERHGRSKSERALEIAKKRKAEHDLDQRKRDP